MGLSWALLHPQGRCYREQGRGDRRDNFPGTQMHLHNSVHFVSCQGSCSHILTQSTYKPLREEGQHICPRKTLRWSRSRFCLMLPDMSISRRAALWF